MNPCSATVRMAFDLAAVRSQPCVQSPTAYKAGGTWIIEGDLADCFGSIPHHVILNGLRKRI